MDKGLTSFIRELLKGPAGELLAKLEPFIKTDKLISSLHAGKLDSLIQNAEAIYKRLISVINTKDEFGMDPVLVKMLRPVFTFLYDNWWRVEVKGIKNIPPKGKAMIVANHSGMLPYDAVMTNMAVFREHPKKRNVRFLVADFVDNFPLLSLFVQRAGGVKASPENAARLLKKGELVCAFPEGTRGIGKLYTEKYKLGQFGKGGVVKLAKETGAPVVPCAIVGAEDTYPIIWKFEEFGKKIGLPFFPVTPTFPLLGLLGLVPLPSKWTIEFGKPVNYKSKKGSIPQLVSELRSEIQMMIDRELIRRS